MNSKMNRTYRRGSLCSMRRHEDGTSLLEVLMALLVLMVGFVGLAGMQSYALSNNHSAFLRSQATIQAHDLSDRMYANTAGVQAGAYSSISGIPNNPPVCLTAVEPGNDSLATTDCTPAELAQFDAHEWNTTNAEVLPSGQGTVVGPDGNGVYTISISWLEQEADGTDTKTFVFEVKPLP